MRAITRTSGELCITVGGVIVLFVLYVLFRTVVKAGSAMDDQIDSLQDQWSKVTTAAEAAAVENPDPPTAYEDGMPFVVMYVPRLGFTWNKPALEGAKTGTLKRGASSPREYGAAWSGGDFAAVGHRRTYGDPFKDFPKLRPGDAVVLTDGKTWFTYRIDTKPYRTLPSDIAVIDPVPGKSGYTRPGRYLALTTCEPEWGHSHRLVVWAHLDATQPVEAGKPEALRR